MTAPKEVILLSVLTWLCLFLFTLLILYEKKSRQAFIKGGFLIISNERTHFSSPETMPWPGGSGKLSAMAEH